MNVGLISTGIYVPKGRVSASAVASHAGIAVERVRKAGVEWLSEAQGESTSDMAIAAARCALEEARVPASALDWIVYCGDHKDYVKWQAATRVQAELGAWQANCFDLYQTCNSQVLALWLLRNAIVAGEGRLGLVVAAESYAASVPKRVIGTSIFVGDGASAGIVGPSSNRRILGFAFCSDGTFNDMMYVKRGGTRHPSHQPAVEADDATYRLRSPLSDEHLAAFSQRVDAVARELVQTACSRAGCSREDLKFVVMLNGSDAHNLHFLKATSLTGCASSRPFIRDVGHIGAADAFYNIHRACETAQLRPGHRVLVYSGGAGYSWGVMVLEW